MWKIKFFGLKLGQDLKNRESHPHPIFLDSALRLFNTMSRVCFSKPKKDVRSGVLHFVLQTQNVISAQLINKEPDKRLI